MCHHANVACDHKQPEDVIAMAESWLRCHKRDAGPGTRVYHGENTPGAMWASVIVELERQDEQWVVTRLDRNREPLPADQLGLEVVV